MKTLKILGVFLLYPEETWISECSHMVDILRKEQWLDEKNVSLIKAFCDHLQGIDLLTLQETYVTLFDRTPSLSLHLFEHVHGESRDRGQALVDLQNIYREQDLEMTVCETPDYLPLFLEYLSVISIEEAREQLKIVATIFSILRSRLEKRKSSYAALFKALEDLADQKPNKRLISRALEDDEGSELSQFDLDRAWEEQFALSQSGDKTCEKPCQSALRKENLL